MARNKSHIIVGIDIGSYKTKLAIVQHFNNPKIFPKILQIVETESEGLFHGNIIDEKEVAETIWKTIEKLDEDLQKKIRYIVLALGAAGINSIWSSAFIINSNINGEITSLDITRLEEEAEKGLTNFKNRKKIHIIPIKYKIDQNEIQGNPLHMFGKRLEGKFLFILSPILYIEKLEEIMKTLNLEIDEIVAGPLAECSLFLSKKEKMAGTAIINFGHSTTSLLVYENNNPILLSILPYGSNNITNDIALGLSVSLEAAEEIKCGRSELPIAKRKLEEIIEFRIADICEKINLELEKINRRELLAGGIILAGGGSELFHSDYLFKYYLKLPIRFANDELIRKTNKQLADTNFAKAVGLTYFAPIISEKYAIKKYCSIFINNVLALLKRLLP